ncbi:hypothetical protein [Kutzneria kofuensis]|jgi:hypothetical protein|uniref:Putative membrane protein n=1 Tax=Kutzneria kofuensis TaxID=103725 RepID=A0A7W9NIX4_9PSEU|nr:hypothetical protein [Kutzneria kofuensis]MBB5893543.1 putative membrane protein [Kutzneria kofuensis]
MDPRDRADAALARASARNRWAVTPNNATSPMDAKPTVQIPRVVVDAADPREQDPDTTVVLPGSVAAGQVPVPPQQQTQQQQRPQQPAQQHQGQQHQGQQPEQDTKQLPGIIPTTQQTPGRRISLTDRLSGALPESDQP